MASQIPYLDLPFASTRDGVGQALIKLGETNTRVTVLTADLAESTRAEWFHRRYPDRFIEVGVAEQNMAGIAAGLALGGQLPFIMSYAVFSPGLNWGVIRSSICYSNLPVNIVGGHAGLATGPDGATHQALEDIALMRVLPNMTVIAPATAQEAYEATLAVAECGGPVYLRVSKYEDDYTKSIKPGSFQLGHAQIIQDGYDVSLIAHGSMVGQVVKAAQQLESAGISCRVINLSTIKPFDGYTVLKAFTETAAVLSIEDHQVAGGMGSAIAEFIAQQSVFKPFRIMGVHDRFGQSGTAEELYQAYGLDVPAIVIAVKQLLKK